MTQPELMVCVECGKESPPTDIWLPGWGCLYGCLAVCSLPCAEKYAREQSRYGELRPEDVQWTPLDDAVTS